MTKSELQGHGAMLVAELMWGLMAPVSKVVLAGVLTPLLLTDFRVAGAALLFWLVSAFMKAEPVARGDKLRMFFAALLAIVFNQGVFMVGLNRTSPIDASIIATSSPILTMVIAALCLREPVTGKKVAGVVMGAVGALLLILGGRQGSFGGGGIWGDLLCLAAQFSFSLYLVFYKGLTARYSPVTLMKWMFTYATLCIVPFTLGEIAALEWRLLDATSLAGAAVVLFCGTFISYLLVPIGQKSLRPTVVSIYNYLQPVVGSTVAICWGLDRFTVWKAAAVVLVFAGVFIVTRRSKRPVLERVPSLISLSPAVRPSARNHFE